MMTTTIFCGFNPTLVRLAHVALGVPGWIVEGFNPTLVRLARPFTRAVPPSAALFQSHVGSISTVSVLIHELGHALFQSHVGSISTFGSFA